LEGNPANPQPKYSRRLHQRVNHAMAPPSAWIKEHKKDVYSQCGEDGIVETILETLPENDKWCVEFGAWDGVSLSNTRNLINHRGYSAVLIEGSEKRFEDLKRNCACDWNTIALNRFVGFERENNLDHVLGSTPIPVDFDFLSIDVDGNDYHIWRAMTNYRPKLVCIEFNPTIPANVKFVQPANLRVSQGSSLLSLVELGKEKGYELVSVSHFNAFFVKCEYVPRFQIDCNDPHVLWTDTENVTYLFSGYDGTVFLRGGCKLPWHKVDLKEQRFQRLPSFLRRYPGNYGTLQVMAFGVYLLFNKPRLFIAELNERTVRLVRRCRRSLFHGS